MKNAPVVVVLCGMILLFTSCQRSAAERTEGRPGVTATTATSAAGTAQPAAVTSTRVKHENYSVQWLSHDVPESITRGSSFPVHVTVKNTGDWPWPDRKTADPENPSGGYAVRLGYGWKKAGGEEADFSARRGDLVTPVPPGATAALALYVTAPAERGKYELELDLVEELVTWFSAKGMTKLTIPVTVK